MQRVLIFGSRDLAPEGPASPVWSVLSGLLFPAIEEAPMEVIEGGCPTGADFVARAWLANSPDAHPDIVSGRSFPADWLGPCGPHCEPGHRKARRNGNGDYCPAAGSRRNQAMADYLAGRGAVQAWGFVNKRLRDSHGSHDMAMRLWRASVPFQIVQVVTPPVQAPRSVSEAVKAYAGVM